MGNSSDGKEFELFCVIVNFGLGSKVIKIARQNGITGGTVFLGKGTVKSHLLELLDLCDVRKEIVFIVSEKNLAYKVLEELNRKLGFNKPNHGIAFTASVINFLGARNCVYHCITESGGAKVPMYNAIFTVVDKGLAESVLDAAALAGSKGGTVINARGSGIHENKMLFSMVIEPEKEIVMILSENNLTEPIVSSIRKHLKIDEPGKGIMFILDVNQTYGLY